MAAGFFWEKGKQGRWFQILSTQNSEDCNADAESFFILFLGFSSGNFYTLIVLCTLSFFIGLQFYISSDFILNI